MKETSEGFLKFSRKYLEKIRNKSRTKFSNESPEKFLDEGILKEFPGGSHVGLSEQFLEELTEFFGKILVINPDGFLRRIPDGITGQIPVLIVGRFI